MKRVFGSRCVSGFVVLLAVTATLCAQVPTTTVNGIVSDPKDAVIAGARVAAVNKATGLARETSTNSEGLYVLSDLPAGVYDLRIEAKGFRGREFKEVALEVGRSTTIDAKLEVASVGTTVNVTEGAGTIELTQSMIQGQVTYTTVQNIPLNGRNFLELAFLLPGNRPATNFDPTRTNTLEVSSAGGFGRGGNVTVDGGDNNDEVVGGTLANFPQDSVQEFQIATSRFTAEVGRSGHSVINIVTKSGSNEFHGSAFFYERNRNIQALPATFDRRLPEPPFDRQQYGASLGGPLVRDRAWWFASGEYRHQNAAVQTGTRDPATGEILHTSASAPLRDALFSTRVDEQITTNNSLMMRYAFNRSTDTSSGSTDRPFGTAAQRQDSLNRFHSVVAGWTTTISATKVNSAAFHFDNFNNGIPAFSNNAPTTFPDLGLTNELRFPNLADGANFRIPQATHLNRYQVRDSFAWTVGRHTLRFGGEFQRYIADGIFDLFGSGTIFLTQDFADPVHDRNSDGVIDDRDIPIAIVIRSAAPVRPLPIPRLTNSYFGAYVQDDWRVRPNFTVNLGLRWEYDSNLTGTDSTHQACPDLTQQPSEPCVWLAGVLDLRRHPDKKNFGPRVGFAYDPFRMGKTVIRGGYGLYYDRIILEAPGFERVQDDRALALLFNIGSFCTFPGDPNPPDLGTCFAPGAVFATGSPTLANPFIGPSFTSGVGIVVLDKDAHHPLFQQFSLGVQQEFWHNWLVTADGVHVFGQQQLLGHLLRQTTSTSPQINCPGNSTPCTVTDPLTGRTDSVTNVEPSAKSWYDGLLVSVEHKPVRVGRWSYLFNISYTLSKTFNYSNDDQLPFNQVEDRVSLVEGINDLRVEKGYAPADERHRLTFYGLLEMPGGFSLSPIYTFGSGVPADTFLPEINSRLPILPRNSIGRDVKNSDQLNALIDLWNSLPACPAPNPCHAGSILKHVPAGVDYSSPFSSLDLRLTKKFRFYERHSFELMAEVFNLFNTTNVRGFANKNFAGRQISITADTDPTNPDPASHVESGFFAPVSTAGGFFGSGGARAFQFAVRYSF